ncbi:MAG TPA: ABC transporter permease, partial [Candidatus Moranbacteria bacterium]|nr:ABC transporter permease [Candidatus Moranbacteria bacterium]
MRLRQWIALDMRRLFRSRQLIAATLFTPLLGLLVFASIVAPLLLTGSDLRVPYAICNEDKSEPVRQFVSLMTNSESLRELAAAYPVEDVETGYELLGAGRVGVLVHIPADFYQTMSAGQDPVVRLIAYPAHSFEQTMVRITLDGSLRAVGQSENILQLLGQTAMEAGADEGSITALLEAELRSSIKQYMHRRAVLGEGGTISPIGERFPLEYYLSALFSLFAAFAMLPALYLSASDLGGPVCRRGLLTQPVAARRFYFARLLSGAALILLTLLLLLPASLTIQGMDVYWGRQGGGLVFLALAGALPLISLSFSALSLLLATLSKRPNLALWS